MGRLHGDKEEKLIRSGLEVEGKDDQGNVLLGASDFIYACVKEGAKELVILPYFLASGNHVWKRGQEKGGRERGQATF